MPEKYALGFLGLAYYEENRNKLKVVAVDNGSEAVTPSVKSVGDGSYAPLSRPLFVYVSKMSLRESPVPFMKAGQALECR